MMEEQSASQKPTLTGWQAASNAERVRTATTVLPIMIGVAAVLSVFFTGVYLILGRPWQWAWGGIFVTVQAMAFFALAYALARRGHLAAALYLTTLELNFGALIAATWVEGWLVVPVLANFMAIGFARMMANRIQSRVVVLMSGIALVTEILLVSLGRFEKWTSPLWLQLVVTIAVAILVMLLTALIVDSRDKRYEDSLAQAEAYAIELEAHWAMLEQNVAQLALLNDIGGQIAAVLELDSVLDRTAHLVQKSFGYHHVALFTLDREQGELVMRAMAGEFNPLFPPDHRLNLGQGMVGWAGLHGETLLVNDVDAEPRHINFYPDMIPTRSELSVPIRVGEEVVGVLDVQSPQYNAFDDDVVALMKTLANQIAVAVENARLYETVQRELAERKRAEEALRVSEERFALAVRGTNDGLWDWDIVNNTLYWSPRLKEILGYADDELQVGFDTFESHLHPGDREPTVAAIEAHLKNRVPFDVEQRLRTKSGEYRWIHARGQAIWDEDGRPIRMVGFSTDITERRQAEKMLERRAAQLAILNDIGGQITAVLELDSVLERAVRLVQESFGYHHVALFTLDREQGELVMRAGAGKFDPLFPPDHRWNLGQGMVGWVGLHGKTLLANDVDAEPRHINFYPDMIPTRSELSVPIRVGEEVVGVLDVQSPQLNTFDENDVLAMQTLADQLAVALRNAQLYQETVQRLKEVETLDAVTTALTHSLDLDQVLQSIVDSATRLIQGSTSGMIHLANEELGKLIPWATSPEVHIQEELEMPIGEGIAGLVMQEKRLINVPNVEKDPRFLTMGVASSYKSLLTAPLMVDGDCIGTLSLNSSQVGAFNADDERLLTTLAAQATIAVRNARLHQEVQRRVEELTLLNGVGRAVTSSLDLEQVLMRVMEETTHVLGAEVGSILLLDQESNELVFEAAVGPRAKEIKGLRLPLGQGVAGWVAREGQRLLVPDVREDSYFYPDIDETVGFVTKSVLAVPLKVKGKVIGVIEAVNKVEGDFSQEDVALLSSMAQWAAIAIENARLYEGIQQERASLAQRVAERTADLSAANAELSRTSRIKDEFLANMSHELRTPLNAILGMSEALQEQVYGPLNEKQLKSLRSIEESGYHLLSLINDILDVSKIEAGKLKLEVGPVSVESVCQASLGLIKQDAHKKQLKISSSFDNAVTIIQADKRRLKQILVNLLSNAVKFTPEGGAIGLEVVGDAEGEAVHFTVWDTGIGILEEDMGRLFQPFVQLDSSLSRRYAGTGLGLSLVYRLADMHGGSVSLESEVGKGSRFTVSLPWQKVAEEVERSVESVEGEGKGAPRAVPPHAGRPPASSSRGQRGEHQDPGRLLRGQRLPRGCRSRRSRSHRTGQGREPRSGPDGHPDAGHGWPGSDPAHPDRRRSGDGAHHRLDGVGHAHRPGAVPGGRGGRVSEQTGQFEKAGQSG
jgi:PAS domain S-box-containing protein